jgi:hypothetical protein
MFSTASPPLSAPIRADMVRSPRSQTDYPAWHYPPCLAIQLSLSWFHTSSSSCSLLSTTQLLTCYPVPTRHPASAHLCLPSYPSSSSCPLLTMLRLPLLFPLDCSCRGGACRGGRLVKENRKALLRENDSIVASGDARPS